MHLQHFLSIFVVLKSLYICNINYLGLRPTFLLQHILVACLKCWRSLGSWAGRMCWVPAGRRMRLLLLQAENPCFGTWGRLGITHENLGLSLVPVAAHKHFPSPNRFSLHRGYSVHMLGQGTGRLRVRWHSVSSGLHTSCDTPISSCWTLRSQLRASPECAGTQPTSEVRESWQRSVSCSASLSDSQKEIGMTSSFPTCP